MLDLKPCHTCGGARLRQESLNVFLEINKEKKLSLSQGTNPLGYAVSPLSGGKLRLSSSDLKNELSLPDKGGAQRAEGLLNL
jgi:hypothetical protein